MYLLRLSVWRKQTTTCSQWTVKQTGVMQRQAITTYHNAKTAIKLAQQEGYHGEPICARTGHTESCRFRAAEAGAQTAVQSGYADFSTIDWARDSVRDAERQKRLKAAIDTRRGWYAKVWDASQVSQYLHVALSVGCLLDAIGLGGCVYGGHCCGIYRWCCGYWRFLAARLEGGVMSRCLLPQFTALLLGRRGSDQRPSRVRPMEIMG